MNKFRAAFAGILVIVFSGCSYYAPVMPPQGLLFTKVSSIIDTDADRSRVDGLEGESSSLAILGLIAVGDATVTAAAEDAGLNRIDHVEYEYLNVLFLFQQFTIKVRGSYEAN